MNDAERLALRWLESVRRLSEFSDSVMEQALDARDAARGLRTSSIVGSAGSCKDMTDTVCAVDDIIKDAETKITEATAMLVEARRRLSFASLELRFFITSRWFRGLSWSYVAKALNENENYVRHGLRDRAIKAVAENIPESFMLAFVEDSSRLLKS